LEGCTEKPSLGKKQEPNEHRRQKDRITASSCEIYKCECSSKTWKWWHRPSWTAGPEDYSEEQRFQIDELDLPESNAGGHDESE